ncbi:MAG: sigma-54-dependent Fis family transcriptional regulator [Oligoflexales bacterium]|nr:sigma-54-dependent Fis family transcriptional regulator [Oligoflexales bacterium]
MNENRNILVVDDTVSTLEIIRRNLEADNYRVFTATNVMDAISMIESRPVNLVITDYKMPHISGLELIKYVKENRNDIAVIMLTGYPSVESAVKAMKIGADEYLQKPFTDSELLHIVSQTLEKVKYRLVGLEPMDAIEYAKFGIIGSSKPIQDVFKYIKKCSATSATILISGENGTGKELVARAIHYHSDRAASAFVPVNCGAIPEGLFESELFGHMKGSFTGATETRAGFFHVADGGTIFLDEVSETSLANQVKLLRVLQEKKVCMLGSNREQPIQVRVIAATNKNLEKLVEAGHFREDLYYRLNVIKISIPPLKDRDDDVILLSHHFLRRFSKEFSKENIKLSDSVLHAIKNYSWPGNVRELENVILHATIMDEDNRIEMADLPSHMRYAINDRISQRVTLQELERQYIKDIMLEVHGNKSAAAKILGIDRKTLRIKLEDL